MSSYIKGTAVDAAVEAGDLGVHLRAHPFFLRFRCLSLRLAGPDRLAAACADPTGSPDRSLPRDRGSEIGNWCKYVEGPAAECNPSIQRLEPALAVAVKVVGVTAAVPLNSVELACTRAREMNTVCAAAQLSPAVLGSSIARSLLGKVGELRPVMLPLAAVGAAVATALSSTRVGRSTKSNNFKTI